jgi:hypothetical protein
MSATGRLATRVRILVRAASVTLLLASIGLTATMTLAQTPTRPPAKGRARPTRPHKAVDGGAAAAAFPRADKVDAGGGGDMVAQKTLDGGTKVFRFGELEIEGRLKNPQLVFFLRRVRAEFAAGDLGHRSFMRELDETKLDPNF